MGDSAGSMNRRDVIKKTLAMASIPGFCCTTDEAPAASYRIAGNLISIDLRRTPSLRRPGGAVKIVDIAREINLIVVHPGGDNYAALERSCTHGGNQVVYNPHNKTVQCTSWGHAEFALDGAVLGGSAKKPLAAYTAQADGLRLEITLEPAS